MSLSPSIQHHPEDATLHPVATTPSPVPSPFHVRIDTSDNDVSITNSAFFYDSLYKQR
jgi:hypothetical protein